ncbi:FMN-linked oxidoreductase [Obba rivulosa]|uniref:FMN-linked oxidoreductase n=1 Tax=Obba rivulosa TaxID=1052685 RepID=A0A8E2B067_9APHY|nr:FMN-linked oxidoreductase [Obba rivulosa]
MLFQPTCVGSLQLEHRVVLAPMTRLRASVSNVQSDIAVVYYAQRASVPGTLLISEGVFVVANAGGYTNVPGLWNDEQIAVWKKVTDAVHAKGCYIFCQFWALGRAANPEQLNNCDPRYDVVSASDIPLTNGPKPRPLRVAEIKEYIEAYSKAAHDAVHRAGFDGVELHGANGYLIDQFLQDVSNNRTDEYGGSIVNRCRFPLEVIKSIVDAIGENRTGVRLSPWGEFNDMRMADPIPTFKHFVTCLKESYQEFAYVHLVEPRISGSAERDMMAGESNDFIREVWLPRPLITAGGYTRELALQTAEKTGELIAFGRYFISNPDLPWRLKHDAALAPYDRDTFYLPESPKGYIDYPFSEELRSSRI